MAIESHNTYKAAMSLYHARDSGGYAFKGHSPHLRACMFVLKPNL